MDKLTIKDLDLRGKRVFIRVDFNVPMKDGAVTDDTRIRETLPTLNLAIEKGGRLVLASHLGRPKGGPDPKYSLQPAAKKLEELLGKPVAFGADCIGPGVEGQSKALRDGEVLVLENVRFHPEEEKNDEVFSRQLAALCDGLFVLDAFGSSHRAHASVVENLMKIADALLVGGGMAYTFLKSQGSPIGKSLVENDKLDLAKKILSDAEASGKRLLLPLDHVTAPEFKADAPAKVGDVAATSEDQMGLDIGPKTVAAYAAEIAKAKTIVWNGPMGV